MLPSMSESEIQPPLAADVHAPERNSLRDRPLHGTAGGGDGKAFGGAPKGAGRVVAGQAGVAVHVAGDVHRIGRDAQSQHLGIEAHRHVHVILAGKEKKGVAFGTELVFPLDREDLVDLLLNGRGRHRRVEDEHVRPEIRFCCAGCRQGRQRGSRKNPCHQGAAEGRSPTSDFSASIHHFESLLGIEEESIPQRASPALPHRELERGQSPALRPDWVLRGEGLRFWTPQGPGRENGRRVRRDL
jgi:hypothetical protein